MARVIDSSVLIAIERRGRAVEDLAHIAGNESVAIAAVTAGELLAGAESRQGTGIGKQSVAEVESLLQGITILPYDMKAARIYAQLYAQLRSTGQMIGAFDLLIAATALANGCSVVTLNLREFNRVPGLTVLAPDW